MTTVFRHGLARLRHDRGRALLTACGTAAAAAMIGAGATLVFALATGFDRTAALANVPDVTATFGAQPLAAVDDRVRALPNIDAIAYRLEAPGMSLEANGSFSGNATVEGVRPGPRGYAVVSGRDVERAGEAVVERGLAKTWKLGVGRTVRVAATLPLQIVGIAVAPTSVSYPLVRSPRIYASYDDVRRLEGAGEEVNVALLWLRDPAQLDVTLAQARAASYGLSGLQFVTRHGYERLIGRAAGIVIALLVAFSLVALAAAGIMLAASSTAEVERRREAVGVLRAVGASRWQIAAGWGLETAVVSVVAAVVGLLAGWYAVSGPTSRLLGLLNEVMPRPGSTAAVLAGCLIALVALVAAATAAPAWRAARQSPVASLRGAGLVGTPRRVPLPGLAGLGARLALARPLRAAALVVVLAVSGAVVLLILTIASLLHGLERNAQTLGTRYQLTVTGGSAADVRAVPGVAEAAPRYVADAADSFDLGESFELIAFPGDHSRFEAPELVQGRRVAHEDEAEVGFGLAQALDLHPGAVLAAQLPSGREARFRVVGIVEALRNQGLLAYVQPKRLLRAVPGLSAQIAVKVRPGTATDAVARALSERGLYAERTGGIAEEITRSGSLGRTTFLHVLAVLLRSVAALDGLVCLYALGQMLALIARERRGAVAIVRACGASRPQVLALFLGSALLVAALAAPLAIVLERFLLGPEVARLALSYVTLSLRPGTQTVAVVIGGLAIATVAASALATRAATAQAIVAPLREE